MGLSSSGRGYRRVQLRHAPDSAALSDVLGTCRGNGDVERCRRAAARRGVDHADVELPCLGDVLRLEFNIEQLVAHELGRAHNLCAAFGDEMHFRVGDEPGVPPGYEPKSGL